MEKYETQQTDIFSFMYEHYKIKKTIRLISLFSGYDSQLLSLKYLKQDGYNLNVESHKTCEWAIKSIQALKDLHHNEDDTDYSNNLNFEELVNYLSDKGISADYNKPMTKDQVKRLGEEKCRTIYNNIKATHNMVNIMQVKGSDLEISEQEKYEYIMTYSFPCQDLSLAGNKKGMSVSQADGGTRSGLLWEVERILNECQQLGTLPNVLLMENVDQVHSKDNVQDFIKWQLALEKLGYKNYWNDLNAKDYYDSEVTITYQISNRNETIDGISRVVTTTL